MVADRSRNRVFRDCNSFLVPTETVALPGNIFGGVYVPGKYGKRVGFSKMLLQRGNVFIFKNVRFQRKSSFYFIFHLQRGNVFIFKNNNCIGSYSFKPDPDPAKKLNTDPDPDPGPCFSKSIFAIASFSAVARLRVSRRQIAFASRTPRREYVRVCPPLVVTIYFSYRSYFCCLENHDTIVVFSARVFYGCQSMCTLL